VTLPAGANANGTLPRRRDRPLRRVRTDLARDRPAWQVSPSPGCRAALAPGRPARRPAGEPTPQPGSGHRLADRGLRQGPLLQAWPLPMIKRLNKSQPRNYISPGKTSASS
jgi:hypothetical protein